MNRRISISPRLRLVAVLCVVFLAAGLVIDCFTFGSGTENLPPVYLMIIVHNEEDTSRGTVPKANIPDYESARGLALPHLILQRPAGNRESETSNLLH